MRGIVLAMLFAFVIGAILAYYALIVGARRWPGWFAGATGQPVASAPPPPVQASRPPATASTAAIDPQLLAMRTTALSAQIAALEARTVNIDADVTGAAGQAARGEALLVAFAARRAIDRGVGLGYLEEQLRVRFGTVRSAAVAQVIDAARHPVTLDALRSGLDAAAPELIGSGRGWIKDMGGELRRLVVIHEAGSPSPLPRDTLARARRLLDAGQVTPAIAEVQRLPRASRIAVWREAAARYVAVRGALDILEGTALLGQARSDVPVQVPPVDLR